MVSVGCYGAISISFSVAVVLSKFPASFPKSVDDSRGLWDDRRVLAPVRGCKILLVDEHELWYRKLGG
jgi:hypothetical protein